MDNSYAALARSIPVPANYTFMQVHVLVDGKTANEKFFIGPLPEVGQPVEIVYVGSKENGEMNFQLRVKAP